MAAVLAWLLLFNEALARNMGRIRESVEAWEEEQKQEEPEEKSSSDVLVERIEEKSSSEAPEERMEEKSSSEAPEERMEEKSSSDASAEERTEKNKESQTGQKTPENDAGEMIRVLLMNSDYSSCFHSSVTIIRDGEEKTVTPEDPLFQDGPIQIEAHKDGITVASICRHEKPPVYQGKLEIHRAAEGLFLINELPLEIYLEAVVPSEMPASFHMEALKAQAVCARTYARRQMEEKRLEEYGADVDDSVRFQVYGSEQPDERASQAVRETEGQVLTQDGQLIQAYYFSTSAGVTSTDEVWGASEAAPYLKSVECTFDSDEPWSSWKVSVPWEFLEDRARSRCPLGGELKGLEITAKSQSGAVIGLRGVCETGSFTVEGEYEIREFFSPRGCVLTGKNGAALEAGELLPSAYFSLDTDPGKEALLCGGGFGHGVGMSQNAANEMGKEGYDYKEILNYFFRNVELTGERPR